MLFRSRSYLAAFTGKAFANNQNNVTLMSLEREAETTRELYLSLVSRLKTETAALAGQGVTSSLLSSAPVPNEHVSPTHQKPPTADRTTVVERRSVSVSVDTGGPR